MKRPQIDVVLKTLNCRGFTSIHGHEVMEHPHIFPADWRKDSVTERLYWLRTTMACEADFPFYCERHIRLNTLKLVYHTGYRGVPCFLAQAFCHTRRYQPRQNQAQRAATGITARDGRFYLGCLLAESGVTVHQVLNGLGKNEE
jgi:hypothetical protein